MRVLVTGGAGYIGSHTLIELRAQGHEVCVIDNFDNSSPVVLTRVSELIQEDIRFYEVDIRDSAALDQVMDDFRPEAVVHFAGLKAVRESADIPLEYYDVNVSGTLCLLRAMQRAECHQIVFSSSATVYGEPQYLPFDEGHPCAPTNVYGHSKHMAERILEDWRRANLEASVVVLRYFNPVGAHTSAQIGEDPQAIPNNLMSYVAQVAIGRRDKVSIFGNDYDTPDGTGMRDYIHITDLARAHSAALDLSARQTGYEIFNVGTGRCYSVLEMIDAFSTAAVREIPREMVARRAGDVARSVADPRKANEGLSWVAECDLAQMCSSVWQWQEKNPMGYREEN
jgi:UDP-glucose 4-epimerase